MSLKSKNLVAILGGRPYIDNITLRRFLIPPIREKLKKDGIDFIIATNNSNSAKDFRKIKDIVTIETSESLHNDFLLRQREIKTNLGAETRETINQYAIENNYDYVLHLDDNITQLFYQINKKNITIKKNKSAAFYDILKLLFFIAENSNTGAVGLSMSSYPSLETIKITAGFPYSFFVHRVDKNFQFENSTEDDILMSIYNGMNKKPSCVIRNALLYGKTGKKTSMDGNRKIYNAMLKDNKRGEYAESMYPNIYTRKVSYMVKSSTIQKEAFLQHKHKLKKPKEWDNYLKLNKNVIPEIKKTIEQIRKRESNEE
jgi:hypothetical protein